jgi:hypothetical protein
VHAGQVEAEPVGVGDHRIRGQPGVEQHGRRGVAAADGDQRGEAVLGHQPDVGKPRLELGRLGSSGCQRRSGDGVVAGEQGVVDVVDQLVTTTSSTGSNPIGSAALPTTGCGIAARTSSAVADSWHKAATPGWPGRRSR